MENTLVKKEIRKLFDDFPKVRFKNPSLALAISDKALKLSREIEDQEYEARSLVYLAVCHIYLSNYTNALDFLNQALKIAKSKNLRDVEGEIYNCFGVINENYSNYSDCLDYYFRALKIFKEIEDNEYMCMVLTNITGVYFITGDRDNAVKYSELAHRSIIERMPHAHTLYIRSLINLGEAWLQTGDMEKALRYFNEAMNLSEKHEDRFHLSDSLYAIGEVNRREKNISEAFNLFSRARKIKEELNHPLGVLRSNIAIAKCYKESGDIETALYVLQRLLPDAERLGYKMEEIEIYKLVSEITSKTGTKERFIRYFTIYKEKETEYFKEQYHNKAIMTGLLHEMNMNDSSVQEKQSEIGVLKESMAESLKKIHSVSEELLSSNGSSGSLNEKILLIKKESEYLMKFLGVP
ncbi:MAG: tetratricopeptide repeat protein [Ignavibacteria bacterium]|nr:tetratricopeptide repeat protein [Ignavibacteria bacterium]